MCLTDIVISRSACAVAINRDTVQLAVGLLHHECFTRINTRHPSHSPKKTRRCLHHTSAAQHSLAVRKIVRYTTARSRQVI